MSHAKNLLKFLTIYLITTPPLKQKQIRGNRAPFMTKDLSKAIMNKSKTKNKYLSWPSRKIFISHKKIKNKCNSLTKKVKRQFFKQATKNGIMTNKKIWRTVKPFLRNNACISNDFIGIENEFNEHYINMVEKSSGKKPLSLGNSSDTSQNEMTVKETISVYSNHPRTRTTKILCVPEKTFDSPYANTSGINKIIKSLHLNKAKGSNGISVKFVKMSANVIDCHLANRINNDISSNKYSKHVKTATVRPIFKKR